ncbi:MAG: DUF1643 domain-containing protein [Candidatus Lambdaproteobacteria bacterium]|nr:DUF1643 domain-containing protein [Candidatus Lambdaproteobacteria bacterium]
MRGSATFDPSGRYRYRLIRAWSRRGGRVAFILLNPNTADAERDDATIRRCLGFARGWGHGSLEVVNLFAWCAPRPALLRLAPEPVGPGNDAALRQAAARADRVVAAWGVHGAWRGRDAEVLALLAAEGVTVECFGFTKCGAPRHPLYLPRGTGVEGYR